MQQDTASFCNENNQEISSSNAADSPPEKLKAVLQDDFDATCLEDMPTPQLSVYRPRKHIKLEKID